jgi:hypothetical protein
MPHVTLYQEKVARLKSIVTATINENGTMLVEGYDIGQLVEKYWDNSNYEYSMKLLPPSVEKLKMIFQIVEDEVLLSSIQQQFGGALAFSTFKLFLDQNGVVYEYFSWT